MSAATDKRIAAIRAKVRDERALLSALSKQVSVDLKKLMEPASYYLDDVEGFFLAPRRCDTRRVRKVNGHNGSATLRLCCVALFCIGSGSNV